MSNSNDGGPAFPKADDRDPTTGQGIKQGSGGMSLRDWYVGQYIAGNRWTGGSIDQLVADAHRVADAILATRLRS